MTPTPADDPAWAALLPTGTVWLDRPRDRAVGVPGVPAGFAVATGPWSLRARPGRGPRTYIAVPSRRRPLIVASWDPVVLRYLAEEVLSVPPGTGQTLSLVFTVGLRLLRYRGPWLLAAAVRAGGAVLVGRPG